MTFGASGARKKKAFIVTAELHENHGTSSATEYDYFSCGFGTAFDIDNNSNIKIGSITPQEIDGFKIIDLNDQGYDEINFETGDEVGYRGFVARANRKCILHIKGKDYSLIREDSNGDYILSEGHDPIGIKDKEQVKVTYTLL